MANKKIKSKQPDFALGKKNYLYLVIGFIIIIIGFSLMIGGKSDNPDVFSKTIFSTRRVVIAPLVALFGFLFEIWAIMKKPDEVAEDEKN